MQISKLLYKKYIKIFKRILCLVLIFCLGNSQSFFAKNNVPTGKRKGGYNILPSQGPIVNDDFDDVRIINKDGGYILKDDITTTQKMLRNAKTHDIIYFGRYEQDGIEQNGQEPIEWIVLSKDEDGRMFLASRYILDCQKFNSYPAPVTWERCTLRSWLNKDFYNLAFNEEEVQYIRLHCNANKKNYFYNTDCGISTYDKVFCLSMEEAINYFEDAPDFYIKQQNCLLPNDRRKCLVTPYAKSKGVRVSNANAQAYGCGNYWLRTLGQNENREWYNGIFNKYYAVIVGELGYIKPMGTGVHSSDDGVRPCIIVENY